MTIKTKKEIKGAHEHIDVFVGPDKDHLALSGCLVLRHNEAKEVEYALTTPHKVCVRGKTYSVTTWEALKLVGFQPTENDDGDPLTLELRNCVSCGSTIACVESK